jgi:hypothetical protein
VHTPAMSQQAAPRGWATCQPKPPPHPQLLWLQPLQQRPMWSRWMPTAWPKASRAALTHGWWLMVDYCGFMGIFVGDDCKMGNSCQKLVGFTGSQKVNWAMLMLGKHRLRLEATCRMPSLHPIQAFCG